MLVFDALVRGRVMYEVADGPPERIPMGRCRVETHEGFVSLTSVSYTHLTLPTICSV